MRAVPIHVECAPIPPQEMVDYGVRLRVWRKELFLGACLEGDAIRWNLTALEERSSQSQKLLRVAFMDPAEARGKAAKDIQPRGPKG